MPSHRRWFSQTRPPRPAAERALLQQIRHAAVGWWAARWFADRLRPSRAREAEEWRLEEEAAIRALAADLRKLRQSAPKAGDGAPGAMA